MRSFNRRICTLVEKRTLAAGPGSGCGKVIQSRMSWISRGSYLCAGCGWKFKTSWNFFEVVCSYKLPVSLEVHEAVSFVEPLRSLNSYVFNATPVPHPIALHHGVLGLAPPRLSVTVVLLCCTMYPTRSPWSGVAPCSTSSHLMPQPRSNGTMLGHRKNIPHFPIFKRGGE